MEELRRLLTLFDKNIIYCLPFVILTLIVIRLLFKNRDTIYTALQVIRWTIIGYTAISLLLFLIGIVLEPEEYTIVNRATGPYAWAYWMMLFAAFILPCSLLNNKLGSKIWYLLLISILMKIGSFFEFYVIILTSISRNYWTEESVWKFDYLYPLLVFAFQGILLAILLIGGIKLWERIKETTNRG